MTFAPQRSSSKLGVVAPVVVLAALASASSARASNDDGVLLGNDAALTAGAVTASVRDGSALWYDPAGLAAVDRAQADVSASAFVLRLYSLPGLMASSTGESADGDHVELVSVSGALTFVRPIGPNVRLGFGLFVPQASSTSARVRLDVVQPEGRVSWIFTVDESDSTYHGAVGLGLRLGSRLRVGAALFGVYSQTSGHVQLWGGGEAATGEMGFIAFSALYSLQSIAVEAGVGLQWQPVRQLRIGLSVRSPGLGLVSRLSAQTLTGVAGVGEMGMAAITFEPGEDESLEPSIGLQSPARVRLGVAWQLSRGWISLDADVQHALHEPDLLVDRRLVWNVRAGGRWQVAPSVALGLGVFTDRSADPDPREFGDSRVDFYGVAGGVEIRSDHPLARSERARDIVFSSTIGFRYALGIGETGGLVFDGDSNTTVVPVDTTVHEITFHLGSGLYF